MKSINALLLKCISALFIIAPSLVYAAPPGMPINPAVRAIASDMVEFSWSLNAADVNNVSGFIVSRFNSSNSYPDPAMRSIQLNACPGKAETYSVAAYNQDGNSPYTAPVSFTLPNILPGGILNFRATSNSATEVFFGFGAVPCNATGAKIERATSPTGDLPPDSAFVVLFTYPFGAGPYLDRTVAPDTTYYYRARAYNAVGVSTIYSPSVKLINALQDPTYISASISSATQVYVSWDSPNPQLATSWSLERRIGASGSYQQIGNILAPARGFMDPLPGQGLYYYRVKALSAILQGSGYSPETSIDFGPPSAAPSNLVVGPYKFYPGLNLSWVNSARNSQGYIIERATAQGGPWTAIFPKTDPLPVGYLDFDEQTALPGITYYYRMANTNVFGDSAFSNIASGSYGPVGDVPQPPRNLRVMH